ncbi:MAG: PIN domain-containing protein [Bryobacterales bacterium]|nr:PIN domain-containing protein [Bryobacterales bacterium]
MVLADTSVWIWFLRNREPYAGHLDALLDSEEVVGHDLVYGELLIGDPGGNRQLLADYNRLPRIALIPHGEVVDFVRAHKLYGQGIGWTDAHLLASARVAGVELWTADDALARAARKLALAHQQ